MRQVVVIHGGDSFATYEEFWKHLCETILHLDRLRLSGWKGSLQAALGDLYDVVLPRMPNPQNAKYAEWKLWFEKLLPELEPTVLLVGHSLGGSFLAKYLSENKIDTHILGTYLVAAPFDTDGDRALHDFNVTNDLALLREQGGHLFLYHSEDDPIVAFSELAKFVNLLPDATVRTFTDREHFQQPELPELVADIRSLS